MATVASTLVDTGLGNRQSGSPLARAIDRWIYVFMAGWFMVIVLGGFVPDAIGKVIAVRAGLRPPFAPILHVHAVLMGSLLLLLLAQTILMATGRRERHQWLGRSMMVLAPAIFVTWLILVPTVYHQFWYAAQSPAAPVPVKKFADALNDIFLGQMRVAILFPLFIFIALQARKADPGLHKRMMILAIATLLPPAFARMWWLPHPFPGLMTFDFYILLVLSPMFVWDVIRTRTIPRAYLIWVGFYAVVAIPAYALFGSPWLDSTVPRIMGVA